MTKHTTNSAGWSGKHSWACLPQASFALQSGERYLTKRAAAAVKKLAALALGVAALLAAGCGSAHPVKYYQLSVPVDVAHTTADPNAIPITLLIGRITATPLYREDQIVYGESNSEAMGVYDYHRWAEPPTDMIQEILLRRLRASGHYQGVTMLRSQIRGDFLVHGHLYDFKQVNGSALVARVTLELELRNIKTGVNVWSHFYTHDEPTTGKDVDATVSALDKNLQQGITEGVASLNEYFTAHPPTTAP
jgi:ABC-type uncharacterized transport system auxiliary subunit